jgi:hypothetical protein
VVSLIHGGLQLGHNGVPGCYISLFTKEESLQGTVHLSAAAAAAAAAVTVTAAAAANSAGADAVAGKTLRDFDVIDGF